MDKQVSERGYIVHHHTLSNLTPPSSPSGKKGEVVVPLSETTLSVCFVLCVCVQVKLAYQVDVKTCLLATGNQKVKTDF